VRFLSLCPGEFLSFDGFFGAGQAADLAADAFVFVEVELVVFDVQDPF